MGGTVKRLVLDWAALAPTRYARTASGVQVAVLVNGPVGPPVCARSGEQDHSMLSVQDIDDISRTAAAAAARSLHDRAQPLKNKRGATRVFADCVDLLKNPSARIVLCG